MNHVSYCFINQLYERLSIHYDFIHNMMDNLPILFNRCFWPTLLQDGLLLLPSAGLFRSW